MGFLEIMIIAIGLSMDAFAVSISLGLSVTKLKVQEWLIPGIFFGFFQALMPFIGYVVGMYFADTINDLDHWVAFVLLGFIGGKMIRESFLKDDEKINKNVFQCIPLLLLAIATSIDALAAGIPFALFKINIFKAITITGVTTFCISIAGVKIGNRFGIRFKSKAELSGGIVLVLLGLKILIEHLFF